MRERAAVLREPATPWLVACLAIGVAAIVAAVLMSGPPTVGRTATLAGLFLLATALGALGFRLSDRWTVLAARRQLQSLIVGLSVGLLLTGAICALNWLANGGPPPFMQMRAILLMSCLTCVAFAGVASSLRPRPVAPPPPADSFNDRLPSKLRGAELSAVEACDHYVRVHTSRGQALILMRLTDALTELESFDGARVHRSWWVARGAVADMRRRGRGATLTLKDGVAVPVSRTFATALRRAGWF